MPSNTAKNIKKRLDAALRRREQHLARACYFDARVDALKVELASASDTPIPTDRAANRFRPAGNVPHNIKMSHACIPEAICLVDAGFSWADTAAKFGIKQHTLKERVYRYLIDQGMLTTEIVDSIWRGHSYVYLAKMHGKPTTEAQVAENIAA